MLPTNASEISDFTQQFTVALLNDPQFQLQHTTNPNYIHNSICSFQNLYSTFVSLCNMFRDSNVNMFIIEKRMSLQEEINYRYGSSDLLRYNLKEEHNIDSMKMTNTKLINTKLSLSDPPGHRCPYVYHVHQVTNIMKNRFGLVKFLSEQNPGESILLQFDKYLNANLISKIIESKENYIVVNTKKKNIDNTLSYMQSNYNVYLKR